jgi:activator of Hsp90 ATPase protein 1
MDSKKHAEFTGDSATIDPKVGGKFNLGGGYISGKNLELVAGKRIVQEWTTSEWPEGYPPSRFEITLTAKSDGTLLKMIHSQVPAEQRDSYADGWKTYYWEPLKEYFRTEK